MILNQEKPWYVVQCKPKALWLAKSNLHFQGFQTFLPVQQVTVRKRMRFIENSEPLFPGYIFVTFNIKKQKWHSINFTRGVSKLISLDGRPQPVPPDLITGLLSRCNPFGELLPPKRVKKGDLVELFRGSFSSFVGTVEEIGVERRVWILGEFMGQTRRLNVKQDDLKVFS